MATKKVSNAISEARIMLHDTDPQLYRYSTADLVTYFNNALLEMRRIRPDAFRAYIGDSTPSYTIADLNADFPVSEIFFTQCVFYIVGMAELRDDEFTVDGRAITLMTQFTAKLLTVA